MASNKNQHFVSRCYLRPFTVDAADAAINLFNIDRRRFIQNAPVKNQCSGDYFYGKNPALESAIQRLEGEYASALRVILAPLYMLTPSHGEFLKRFWLLQYLRTEAASLRTVALANATVDIIGPTAKSFKMEIRDAVQIAMMTFAKSMNVVADLQVALIQNKSQVPFITSDDPAVLTNRWYFQSERTRGATFGVHSAGSILILPLSPEVAFIAYDRDVYSVPRRNGWVAVRRDSDVNAINEHQFLDCHANIYVRDSVHATLVAESFDVAAAHRLKSRHAIHYAIRDYYEEGITRYRVIARADASGEEEAILHAQTFSPQPISWPQLLSWRRRGVVFYNGTGVGYVRRNLSHQAFTPRFWKERTGY